MSQSVEYTAAGALIRYTDTAGDDVSFIINPPSHHDHHVHLEHDDDVAQCSGEPAASPHPATASQEQGEEKDRRSTGQYFLHLIQ